jgi:uncharacterized protein (DUF433 family)
MTAEVLDQPLYAVSEAARLLDIPPLKLRRWLDGFTAAGRTYPPVIRVERTGSDSVTWAEFVEAGFLAEYRSRRVSLQHLRPMIDRMREVFEVRYPLAEFKPLVDRSKRVLVVELQQVTKLDQDLYLIHPLDRGGQLQWTEPVLSFLDKVEFDPDGVAERMRPLGRAVNVVIDPRVSFGVPQVRGIRTETIAEAYATGESPKALARECDLPEEDVHSALRWELRLKAA